MFAGETLEIQLQDYLADEHSIIDVNLPRPLKRHSVFDNRVNVLKIRTKPDTPLGLHDVFVLIDDAENEGMQSLMLIVTVLPGTDETSNGGKDDGKQDRDGPGGSTKNDNPGGEASPGE